MVACSGVGSPALSIPLPATPTPDPETVVWEGTQGIYAKVERTQFESATHIPDGAAYLANPEGFTRSVYYELNHYKWLRGIMVELAWGECETSQGVYNFDKLIEIMDTVRDLGLNNGQNKKVLLLLPWKAFSIDTADNILPGWLLTTGTPYSTSASGPLTEVVTNPSPPPATIDQNVQMPRYDRSWGYKSEFNQPDVSPYGYHWRTADFRDGLTGNDLNGDPIYTLRNAYYAFMTAAYAIFRDHEAFAGFIMVEPPPLSPVATSVGEYNETNHFNGRLTLLKWLRALSDRHMVVEAPNHNNKWCTRMTNPTDPTGTDGCLQNHLGFTGPNMHTGQNLFGLYNARKYLAGEVPVVVQCQPQDMKSMSGNITKANTTQSPAPNDYWRWDKFPPDYGGVTTAGPTQGDPNTYVEATAALNDDPITDGDWVIVRSRYLGGNLLIYQRNIFAGGNPFDWDDFINYMQTTTSYISPSTGILITNDVYGGMIPDEPTFVV